jgi:hypothetical protein
VRLTSTAYLIGGRFPAAWNADFNFTNPMARTLSDEWVRDLESWAAPS